MNTDTLRNDILAVLKARKIRLYRLARESGVDSASLWKFIHKPAANLNTDSLFKLWPHIYGEQTPKLLLEGVSSSDSDTPSPLPPAKEDA